MQVYSIQHDNIIEAPIFDSYITYTEGGDKTSSSITWGEFSKPSGGGNCMWLEAINGGKPTAAQQWVAV